MLLRDISFESHCEHHLAPIISVSQQCMTTRGGHKPGVGMVTSRMLGAFRDDAMTRREFLAMIGNPPTRAA